ncbi:MAG: 2-amino-4-hydroxy-6-hydroxymethyldihydropteridine diphosphokinase [bacterium]
MVSYIGVGSNLNEPTKNIERARELLLSNSGINFIKSSSLYETSPWGVEDQPNFVNAVWQIETELTPTALFLILKNIESSMGRKRCIRYGPRIIDLDILFYDNLIYQDLNLTIPHPKLQERSFVLFPLCEVSPDLIHPLLNKGVSFLKDQLKDLLNIRKL